MFRTQATARSPINQGVPASLPAPVGGWNARDALGAMKPLDAVTLTNWFPGTSDVSLRYGYTNFATGLPSQVETLMSYSGGATDKLFAISGTAIYDITAGGAVGAASVSSLTNARFQHINVATAGGSFLLAVNGADKLRGFDGTNWWTDGDGTHDITVLNTANAIGVCLFKNRVWLVEKNTLSAWYLPTSAIAGAATAFPLQSIASLGGYIMAIGTWTIDAGTGVDDLIVFVTSKGEVIVYRGTDPASASTFALVGVWQLGAPIGRRCLMKYSGDLLLICQDGLLPLSSALQSSRVNPSVALSDKIKSAASSAVSLYGSTFGWETLYFAKENMLFLNVPVSVGAQQQYVMNTITKAWCNFTGWAANCWEVYQDNPYFGGSTVVCRAWNGQVDGTANISADGKQAFNYFGAPGQLKQWTMMRPILSTNGSPGIAAGLNVDFEDVPVTATVAFSTTSSGTWDSGLWDAAVWGGDTTIQKQWQGVTGLGYCAASRLQVAAQGIAVRWIATDLVMRRGAIL
jgi:hypothetical protein